MNLKSILAAAAATVSMNAVDVMAQDAQGYTGPGMGKHIAVLQLGENPVTFDTSEVQGLENCAGAAVEKTVNFNQPVKFICIDSNEISVLSGSCVPNGTLEPNCSWTKPEMKTLSASALTPQP